MEPEHLFLTIRQGSKPGLALESWRQMGWGSDISLDDIIIRGITQLLEVNSWAPKDCMLQVQTYIGRCKVDILRFLECSTNLIRQLFTYRKNNKLGSNLGAKFSLSLSETKLLFIRRSLSKLLLMVSSTFQFTLTSTIPVGKTTVLGLTIATTLTPRNKSEVKTIQSTLTTTTSRGSWATLTETMTLKTRKAKCWIAPISKALTSIPSQGIATSSMLKDGTKFHKNITSLTTSSKPWTAASPSS